MKLLIPELRASLPPLYSQEKVPCTPYVFENIRRVMFRRKLCCAGSNRHG